MDTDTQNAVTASNGNAQYDIYAKSLLARKSILSRILAATVTEFKGMAPDDIAALIEGDIRISKVPIDPGLTNQENKKGGDRIAGFNTESGEMAEGTIYYDIVFYVRMRDGLSQIIINVEAQKDESSKYDILNRAIFYVSRLISSQKERDFKGENYNDLKQVWSIWICMNMNECIWNHVHLADDRILANHKWAGKLDLFHVVLLGLPKKLPERDERYELHRMLSALLSADLSVKQRLEILENEYKIGTEGSFREEMNEMCNLSEGVYERGLEVGMEKGREEGKREDILNLNREGFPIDTISRVTGFTAEKVKSILDLES